MIADPLRRLFRPTLLIADDNGGVRVARPGGLLGQRYRIIPRRRCSFDFVAAPLTSMMARRALLLRLELQRPFDEARHYVRFAETGAEIWWFDPDGDDTDATALPESVLITRQPDGAFLARLGDGVEGQIWKAGAIRLSRWWPDIPDDDEWRRFARAGGGEVPPRPAQAVAADWVSPPLIERPVWPWLRGIAEQRALLIGLVLIGLPLSFELTRWTVASLIAARENSRAASLRTQTGPIARARLDAQAALGTVNGLQGLGDEALLFRALIDWQTALAGRALVIENVTLADGQITVRASAPDDSPDGVAIVAALEATDSWQDVALVTMDRARVTVAATLQPFAVSLAEEASAPGS